MAEEELTMKDFEEEINKSFRKIKEGDILTGTVIGIDDDKCTLDLKYYAPGIIKADELSNDPNFSIRNDIHIGDEISATVASSDDGYGNILLSRKEADNVLSWDKLKDYMENKTEVEVTIAEAVKSGCVAFLEGVRGFIPASKLSLGYVEDEKLQEYVGKKLIVRVITVDEEDKKLVLSAKDILREEDNEAQKEKITGIPVGLVTEGTVESIQPYGAFIKLSNGVSGLLHISQISNKRITHPAKVLKEGQSVKVKVIAIKEGKLSLSMKALDDVSATEISESGEDTHYESEGSATTSLADLLKKAGF